MEALIVEAGRVPQQRTTLYGAVDAERRHASFTAAPLLEVTQAPANTRRAFANA
jgi:hypothetical protein